MPYGVVVMSDFRDILPRTSHMFTMLLAHMNSSMNPILYALTNPAYQRGYKMLFSIIFFRKLNSNKNQSTHQTNVKESNTF